MSSRAISFCVSALFFGFVVFSSSTSQPQTNDTLLPSAYLPDDISKAEQLIPVINKYINSVETDIPLVLAVIKVESNFNPDAVSAKGALGLMQLMPETAMDEYRKVFYDSSLTRLKRQLVHQPELNVALGVRYLQNLEKRFSSINDPVKRRTLVLASYNAGSRRVKQTFNCVSDECMKYRVNDRSDRYFDQVIRQLPMETRSYLVLVDRSYRYYQESLTQKGITTLSGKKTRNTSV